MWRDDALLLDMLLSARKATAFIAGKRWENFQKDEILQNAVVHLLEITGEAAGKVSAQVRDAHPEIPWKGIIGMRNRLIHEYFRIDLAKVWEVMQRDLPDLVRLLEPLVPPDEQA